MLSSFKKEHYQFAKIRKDEIWRFYIDGYRQATEAGKRLNNLLFDQKEPGYMQAMLKAHQFMNKTLNEPLTPQLLINLHILSLDSVQNTDNEHLGCFRHKKFEIPADFGLVTDIDLTGSKDELADVSLEGIKEFLNELVKEGNIHGFEITGQDINVDFLAQAMKLYTELGVDSASGYLFNQIQNGAARFYVPRMKHSILWDKVSTYIELYEIEIKQAVTEDMRLEAIIRLVCSLNRLHAFADGNGRVIAMLLLNRELIRNGFPITLLNSPNHFTIFSMKELKQEVKDGQEFATQYQSEIAYLSSYEALYTYINQVTDANLGSYSFFSLFSIQTESKRVQTLAIVLDKIKDLPLANALPYLEKQFLVMKENEGWILASKSESLALTANLINDMRAIYQKNVKLQDHHA